MFSFLGSIVGKIASIIVSVFVTIGIVSSPASVAPQSEEPIVTETATSTVEIQEEIDVKAELDALKKQLADEQKKRKDLEKKVAKPQTASVVTPAPAPTPAPVVVTPPPASTPSTPILQPGEFLLPNGAIANAQGVIIKAAPAPVVSSPAPVATITPATPPPPPPLVWPPAEGSTVDIQQRIISDINFNSHLSCDQLWAIPPSKKDLCKLYKNNETNGKYIWNIIVEDL